MPSKQAPNSCRPVIVLVGPLPPPMHGMAAVNASIFGQLADYDPIIINLARDLGEKAWTGYVTKLLRTLSGCLSILALPIHRRKTFYSSVDDGAGGLLIALLSLSARIRHCRVILHHHSYKYLLRKNWIMRLLVRIAGPNATHVFLCDQMERTFRTLYPGNFDALICPNPVTDDHLLEHFKTPPHPTHKPILTIGFLSNLMFEKGVREFIDVIRQAPAHGLELRGLMAGAAFKSEVQSFVDQAKQELGDRLELLGAVKGQTKIAFFQSIDVLVFPTQYRTEAFSLILMEALLAGCPVIASARGCIPMISDLPVVYVIAGQDDFITSALAQLRQWFKNRDSWAVLATQAHQAGAAIHKKHVNLQRYLLRKILA